MNQGYSIKYTIQLESIISIFLCVLLERAVLSLSVCSVLWNK